MVWLAEVLGEPWNYGESLERYPLNTGRLRAVIERVTQEAGWGRELANVKGQGRGLGLAMHYSFVTYVAAVIEVTINAKRQLTIPRIDVAVDCGPQIEPDRIRSQIEGACVMGLSQALFSELTFKNGRVQQDNFHQFEIARMTAAPKKFVVHLMPPAGFDTPLGGVGEPGVPVIAPAPALAKIENHSHAAAVWRAVELSKTSPAGMMSEGDWRHQSWQRPVGKHRLDPGRKSARRVLGEGEGEVLALGAKDYRHMLRLGLVAATDQSDSA